MEERSFEAIRRLSRQELEAFAGRAMMHIRYAREEQECGRYFTTLLTGFVLGATVAAMGFLAGASLG